MTGYIYKITNTKNQKVYIGQTIQKPCVRFAAHVKELNANKKKNGKFQNAWNKYGKDNFKFEVILECEASRLDEYERFYIALFDSFVNGYNATIGGKQCMEQRRHTDGTKAKLSEHLKRMWNNQEYVHRLKNAHSLNRAVVCVNNGKVFKTSMEAAESIGTNDSNIIRACKKKGMRCGVGANGEPLLWSWDDEYNGYSVMDVYKGRKGGNNRKAVRNIETGIVYQSATAAAEHHNCDKSTILRACHGRLKSADNYHWEFV
jgi:group I intron endonuclease